MSDDFHEHLDTARLWWSLDEAVLEAIAEGPSTQEAFRRIAWYTLDLRRRANAGPDDMAAITKIAIRVAASSPPDVPRQPEERGSSRRRRLALVALTIIAVLALFTAGAAARLFPVPLSIERLLDRIGVETAPLDEDGDAPGRALSEDGVPSAVEDAIEDGSGPSRGREDAGGTKTSGSTTSDAQDDSRARGEADKNQQQESNGTKGNEAPRENQEDKGKSGQAEDSRSAPRPTPSPTSKGSPKPKPEPGQQQP